VIENIYTDNPLRSGRLLIGAWVILKNKDSITDNSGGCKGKNQICQKGIIVSGEKTERGFSGGQ